MTSAGSGTSLRRPAPGLRAGEYELLTPLATGGMGQVYLARKKGEGSFEKRVALKLLLPHLSDDPQFVAMFLDEARIAAQMNHPNIVQIFDLGHAEGRFFIAMALVEGVSLHRLLVACQQHNERLPVPVVRLIASALCEGLHYAHALKDARGVPLNVIHRDVDPANVMVSATGGVLLTDFGIARAAGNLHQTRVGSMHGKLPYMAPEMLVLGRPIDHRVDVFAAAVTLFEALTLRSPFKRDSPADTMQAVQLAELPDLQALRPDVGPQLKAALERATSRDATARQPTARAFLAELLDGPVAPASELGEWVERLCGGAMGAFRGTPEPIGVTHTVSVLDMPVPPPSSPTVAAVPGAMRQARPGQRSTPVAVPASPNVPAPDRASPPPLPPSVGSAPELAQTLEPEPEPAPEQTPPRARRSRRRWWWSGALAAAAVALGWGLWYRVSAPVVRGEAESAGAFEPAELAGVPTGQPPEQPRPSALPGPASGAHEPSGGASPTVPTARETEVRASPAGEAGKRPRPTKGRGEGAALRLGYLSADATPWAEVHLDGQRIDNTPISQYPVPVGRHRVLFLLPTTGQREERLVQIREGQVEKIRVTFGR